MSKIIDIKRYVEHYQKEFSEGLTLAEINNMTRLLPKKYHPIKNFYTYLSGNTAMLINGKSVYFTHDVERALGELLGIFKTNSFD